MNEKDVFKGIGIPIKLETPDKFNVVKETLSRIGILSKDKNGDKVLTQTAHILHKKGKYAIVLFFELFKLDGKVANYNQDDILRRNLIAKLLEEWGLLEVIDKSQIKDTAPRTSISVIKSADKHNVTFVQKYKIGNEANRRSY